MGKIIYAVIGFIVGAILPSILIRPLTSAPKYDFVSGFTAFLFLILIILPAIVLSLVSYFIGRIENVKVRRIIVGSLILVLLVFLTFYIPAVY